MGWIIVALLALGWPTFAQAQGTLAPVAQQVFLDSSGNVLNNAKLCFYAAGTSTPQDTYSDSTLMTLNANPVRTNSAGRPTTGGVYLSATSYKLVVLTAGSDATCSTGTTIYTQDGIGAVPATAVGLDVPLQIAGEALSAGDVAYLSDGSGGQTAGRWYRADADATYASSTAAAVGMVPTAIASGGTGSIRVGGRMSSLSGLTAGELYYVSATAGGLTATPPTNAWYVGKADTTTSLIMVGGAGAVRLPDSDGTHNLVIKTTSDLTADRLLTFVPGDAARTVTITADATIGGNAPTNLVQGRLSLTTALPVTTADVTAATTLYWALYGGNQITLYTGSAWTTVSIAQLSLTMVGLTGSKPYDVFIDYTAGVPILEVVVWTNDSTRATALAVQDGVYVQTADADSRYIGTIYTDAAGGAVTDSYTLRHVWNYYNRALRPMRVIEPTASWTYTLATLRQARATTTNQLDFVIGVSEDLVAATVIAAGQNDNANIIVSVSVGLDSTTTSATGALMSYQETPAANIVMQLTASWRGFPAAGRHTLVWLEQSGATGTTTFSGEGSPGVLQSGISGDVWQ